MPDGHPDSSGHNAQGIYLHLDDGRQLIDGISSWWSVIHVFSSEDQCGGQGSSEPIQSHDAVRLGNDPAELLAERLVEMTPDPCSMYFLVIQAVSVSRPAMKMAIQYWGNQGTPKSVSWHFRNAYHKDTTACMSVADPSEGMHHFQSLAPEQLFATMPNDCGSWWRLRSFGQVESMQPRVHRNWLR